jgi:hypothetical protein
MSIRYSPKIVTDGLVFCVDSGNTKSYNSSSNPSGWTNLMDYNTGSLTAVAVGTSSNAGSLRFEGASSVVAFQENSALNTNSLTIEVWTKPGNNAVQSGFFFEKGNVNTQYSLFLEGAALRFRINYVPGTLVDMTLSPFTDYINSSSFFQIVATYTSGDRRLYINANQVSSSTQTGSITTNANGMSVGMYGGFNGSHGYPYYGNISMVRVYNKALSPNEVSQNYNALKGRYGL